MSKDNLPEEQTPRTEEAPAENQAEETTLDVYKRQGQGIVARLFFECTDATDTGAEDDTDSV